ncbi:MAG: surface lipoprotein assembly modifier [Ignavibacteriota bacterium]
MMEKQTSKYSQVILVNLICLLLSPTSIRAQFSGTLSFDAYRSSNVEGSNAASPDNAFNPSLDFLYNWNIAKSSDIRIEAAAYPTWYQHYTSRDYSTYNLFLSGHLYLSHLDTEKPVIPISIPLTVSIERFSDSASLSQNTNNISHTNQPDISSMLEGISELLDSSEIVEKGLSVDSIDAYSDLKDSISETILAISDIVGSQGLTESVKNVALEEISTQQLLLQKIPLLSWQHSALSLQIEDVLSFLRKIPASIDVLEILPQVQGAEHFRDSSISEKAARVEKLRGQTLADLNLTISPNRIEENSPFFTLINAETDLQSFGTNDIDVAENILPKTQLTFATRLTLPLAYEVSAYRGLYDLADSRTVEFSPRLDFYLGNCLGIGAGYELLITKFPNDTSQLDNTIENRARLDGRLQITHEITVLPQLAFGSKSYARAIKYLTFVPKPGRPLKPDTVVVTTPSNYTQTNFGIAIIYMPLPKLTFGTAVVLSRSKILRPYFFDSILTRKSHIGGSLNDDHYSFDLTKETFFLLATLPAAIEIGIDVGYENRHYANVEIRGKIARLPTTNIQRDDHGPMLGISLSRQFDFESDLIGVFTGFTPTLSVEYSNFTSSVSEFSYSNTIALLSLNFDF